MFFEFVTSNKANDTIIAKIVLAYICKYLLATILFSKFEL